MDIGLSIVLAAIWVYPTSAMISKYTSCTDVFFTLGVAIVATAAMLAFG